MKKHISVFMLIARHTVLKMLALLAVFTAAEVMWARFILPCPPELALGTLPVLLFLVCHIMLSILLWSAASDSGSQVSYTVKRLRTGEREFFLWQALWGCCAYFILWAWQAALAVVLAQYSLSRLEPQFAGPQALMIAFYRNGFLHALVPLADTAVWLRNAAMVLFLGLVSAWIPKRQREGKKRAGLILTVLTIIWLPMVFQVEGRDGVIAVMLFCGACAAALFIMAMFKKEEFDE